MRILITGSAGFIGFHTCLKFLKEKNTVIGIDNLNSYYDVNLKNDRIKLLLNFSNTSKNNFYFEKGSIEDYDFVELIFNKYKPDKVINLAAQAGVRYSLINPRLYLESNIIGFGNILEASKKYKIKHLVYASSSSVYGGNTNLPFSEKDNVDHPVSLYAATKKSNELMAHAYSHLFELPTTGLRFFTVYGPWGRPDMALFKFTKSMLKSEPIEIYNHGKMSRDFTFVDDIVEGVFQITNKNSLSDKKFVPSMPDPSSSWAPFRIFNIGNSNPTNLLNFIECIEKYLNLKAKKIFLPIQPGDVPSTSADTSLLNKWIGFKPCTTVNVGIKKFIDWYLDYYENKDDNIY